MAGAALVDVTGSGVSAIVVDGTTVALKVDLTTPACDNSQDLAPGSGFPAITVPMGYVYGSLPVGLQFFGDAWSESTLIARYMSLIN